MTGAAKSWKRQGPESPLESLEGVCGPADTQIWKKISVVLSHLLFGNLLSHPKDTSTILKQKDHGPHY